MKRSLHVLLAASLLLTGPAGAWSQTVAGRAAPGASAAAAGVTGVALSGAAGAQVLALPPASTPLSAPIATLSAPIANPFPLSSPQAAAPTRGAAAPTRGAAAPTRGAAAPTRGAAAQAVAAGARALPTSVIASPAGAASAGGLAAAVTRHPVIDLLNRLQEAGVSLPDAIDSPADAARLREAAEALPAGTARETLLRLADIAGTPAGAARETALDKLFENGARPAVPASETPVSGSFWGRLSRLPLPSGLKRYAAKRAEAERAKAQPASPDAYKVSVGHLRWTPDAATLEQAEKLPAIEKPIVGQDLALEALDWGLRMPGSVHNVMVTGPDGSGRATATRKLLEKIAPELETPPDLVAVTNAANKEQPLILQVPSGAGPALEKGLPKLTATLKEVLPAALGSGQVAAIKEKLMGAVQQNMAKREAAFQAAVAKLRLADGKFGVMARPQQDKSGRVTLVIAPTFEGKPISAKEAGELIAAGKFTEAEFAKAQAELRALAQQIMQQYIALAQETAQEVQAVQQKIASIDAQVAAHVVAAAGKDLQALVAPVRPHDDARHAELDKRTRQLMAEFKQSHGSKQIGPFFVVIRMGQTENGPQPMPQLNKDGKPVSAETLQEMVESGQMTMEDWEKLQGEIMEFVQEYRKGLAALMKQLEVEHQALHKNDPPPTAAQAQAMSWVEQLLQRFTQGYEIFLPQDEEEGGNPLAKMLAKNADPSEAVKVKVLATNRPGSGAPVIFEKSPTFENLFGSVDDNARIMMVPGAGMVKTEAPGGPELKSGSFIKANGGFLVLDLMDVLREPGSWQALMKAVRTGQAEISEGGIQGSLLGRNEARHAVPTKVKIVLIGSPSLKMLLAQHDPDFAAHFKAEAQFESAVDITVEAVAGYVQFIRRMAADATAGVLELTRDAMVEVLQYGARLSGSHEALTTKFRPILDLLTEATYWARQAGHGQITGADVAAAINKKADFEGRMRRRMQEGYWKDIFHIQTEGTAVGQTNALTVYATFGMPTRVTAVAEAGGAGVTGLDKQAGWAGPSYLKGLETLKSFLAHEFGQKKGLPFEVRISKEQLYGGIDGDSSTSTNIYAALSALSNTPIKQTIAITGSADQFGAVQAIGGVNLKIEGFYDVLTAKLKAAGKELDGSQGVIIPATNIRDLMLRPDIVQAVKAGKFHIWGVTDVRQGIEILTGVAYSEIKRAIELRAATVGKGKK